MLELFSKGYFDGIYVGGLILGALSVLSVITFLTALLGGIIKRLNVKVTE